MLPLILSIISLIIFIILFIFAYRKDCDGLGMFSIVGIVLSIITGIVCTIGIITSSSFCAGYIQAKIKTQNQYNECITLIEAYEAKQDIRYPEVIKTINEYNTLVQQNQLWLKSVWHKDFTYDFYNEMPLINYPKIS